MVGRFWVPNTFPRLYLNFESISLVVNVDARPRSERKTTVVGLRLTTRHGDAPSTQGPLEAPLDDLRGS